MRGYVPRLTSSSIIVQDISRNKELWWQEVENSFLFQQALTRGGNGVFKGCLVKLNTNYLMI